MFDPRVLEVIVRARSRSIKQTSKNGAGGVTEQLFGKPLNKEDLVLENVTNEKDKETPCVRVVKKKQKRVKHTEDHSLEIIPVYRRIS